MRKYFFLLLPNKAASFQLCFVIIYLLTTATPLFSQDIHNLNIEKVQEDGLTNDYIICINQDANGFLWFGTGEGLLRFDGYTFKTFKNFTGDTTTLINNWVNCLLPQKGSLWIGTRGGVSCLDINTLTIKNFQSPEYLVVYSILPKNDSVLWIGTSSGLFQFNKKTLLEKDSPLWKKRFYFFLIR